MSHRGTELLNYFANASGNMPRNVVSTVRIRTANTGAGGWNVQVCSA